MVASIPCFSIYEIVNKVRNAFLIAKIILKMFHTCLVGIIGNLAS